MENTNLKLIPFTIGSEYKVYLPNIQYFINRILNKEYFSFTKLIVEWFMLEKKAWNKSVKEIFTMMFLKKNVIKYINTDPKNQKR